MPGLRSLVARRRSSLTSPPYTVQRNTPSPSLSDTSDHAATPHHSEGGESPMTEREGGLAEVQETQSQDVSDVQGVGGSKTQNTRFVNGEDAEEKDGCSSDSVGNSQQEKSLLDTCEVEDPGGELHTSSVTGIHEEKECVPASDVGVVSDSSSANVVRNDLSIDKVLCEDSEQSTGQASANVKSEEQSHMDTELSPPESDTASQETEPLVNEETSVYKEEEHLETGGETAEVKESMDSAGERLLPGEETQEGSCNVDTDKIQVTDTSDADVRDKALFQTESLGVYGRSGGGGGGGEEENEQANDMSMTSIENENQENYESHLQNVDLCRQIAIPEEGYPCVVKQGANEEVEPTDTAVESHQRGDESFCQSDVKHSGNVETSMAVGGEIQVASLGEPLESEYAVEGTQNNEEFPSYGVKETDECTAGEREGEDRKDAASCVGSEGKEIEPGGREGGEQGGRDILGKPDGSYPVSSEGSEERDSSYGGGGGGMSEVDMNDCRDVGNVDKNDSVRELQMGSSAYSEGDGNYSESVVKETKSPNESVGESENIEQNKPAVGSGEGICKSESPPIDKKAGDASEGSADNKNVLNKLIHKNAKGGKKCSDLSAMEIESTLASRGVTIVRRVVDNKESASRGSESNTVKKETGTSIKPVGKTVFAKALQSPFTSTSASGSGISVSLQPSLPAQANSPTPKDLYKSINARGTHIQSSSKINPALLNRKGSFQLTRGVSIHYNPKSAATNMNVRGNTVYPNPRGVGGVGSRGPRMYANPRVPGPQTLRGLPANIRPRGATLPQTRRGTPQANLRGPVTPVNTRGMGRGQRYAGPRGGVARGAVPQPRAASVTTTNLRGVAPQRFRGGMSQHQPRLPGLLPQGKPTEGILTSKAGETLQSRSTTAPPQAKYLKTSLDSRPGDAALHSNLNSDKMNMPLHSKGLGLSTQPRPPDTLHSPQPGSAEVSPQSRTSQFSPQTLIGGIQPQSEYGGPSAQSRPMEQSPQSVHAMSSASATTSQAGPVSFTSQPVSASHPTLPSSSHHLSQMNMMAPQTSAMGLAPHSGASRLPPHSSGGYLPQPTSLGSSSQVMPSLMATSGRFSANITSAGFPSIPNSNYLGRPGSEMFPSYNNPGEYTPHSSASAFPHMNSGNFGMQSTSAGFHAQTNLVGFPAQGDPCGYPQHASSSEFPPHNPTGVARQTGSDNFSSHPNCSNFPVPSNPGTYPPIPCSEPYSAPTNPGTFRENTDLFNYPGQRDFMMHTGSREFSHYSGSNQMTNQLQPLPATGHRDLPMSQSPRDIPLQNCNQNISMSSSGGNTPMNNIIGDQFAGYGEPLGHSTYQEIPVNARTNPNTVPLAPSFRETDVQQNYRDTATPHYNNYREPNTQEGLRTPQLHSAYRDLPLDPNIDLQTQSAHSGFKDQQQQSARYQEDGIISRYLEQSVLNYPETGNLNSCREQPVPNFGSPASHTSPSEQINQMNFPETMNDTSSRQHLMPGIGEPMNYGGYRGPMEFNSPNPNLQESLNYVPDCRDASNIDQVAKSVADSMYKDHIPVSSYNVNSHHLSLEGVQSDLKFKEKDMNYSETAILPSFTESFDPSSEISGKKDGSSNLPHFRGSSDVSYQRNLPEYTNPATPFENPGGDASASSSKDYSYCLSDSKNSGPRESPVYPGQRGYVTPSGDSYSSVQSCSPDQQYISGSGNNFQAKSDFHIPGDSLVPPDKGILEFPISQGSSTITSTNSTQSDPSGRSVPDSSVSNPETNISSSKVSTSANHVQKSNGQNFPMVTSDKDTKESERSNFFGSVEGRKPIRDPGSDSPIKSPGSQSVSSLEKFPVGMSPTKSESGSPNTQDRIVIKMKLLHSSSSAEEDVHSAENANTTELGLADKSSIKYNLAKYTCWTIDSIINGREDLGNEEMLDQDNDCEIEQLDGREEKIPSMTNCSKKARKRLNSEICEDSKDTNLDTNKNLMKKSLKITISNPMRNKVLPKGDNDEGKVEVKKEDVLVDDKGIVEDCVNVQSLGNVKEEIGIGEQKPESQLQYSFRKGKVGSGKSSPTPSVENCNSSVSGTQPDCEGKKCSKGSEASVGGGVHGAVNDHLVTSDVKKCSIVIKRIYKNDNYSCYSSSLCDKKTVLNIDDGTQRRSKRRAAVEASERCHKTLRSLDTCDAKSGKMSLAGVLDKNKDILSVNLTTNKTIINQIPQCSVLLYDVFMNHRINQMVCPGCSRHYDSSDSVRVNMNKATISLLCSSCQWLVVKDVHPQEVDSLVPS
ncbi:uncharacterized protein LOC123517479 [Portunus trituberculatus]|uniref:uncharacterized protein LOC123517479 n=1 Tax=Portunus trituberculatus TaxID=210409 RepID=UPI001E1CECF1|nr:uncharacterized protein LOC123517479 [Portunus trituberculatus]XP_045133502.1 uncharacterized protein LOC123517479 [Portunus trituberculatus]XP_045133503.1 uncharacterized protein LOC123517479 [Portunus trituberculatus]XP_045133504.1 uncharacterized protein LOC123517479 [Portunus trituberculatus]